MPPHQIVFGDCALDTETFELIRDGVPRKLQRQTYDLLMLLLENRHRVVDRSEIVDQLWDGRIVSDAAISTAIKQTRQAVGDDGKAQAVIRTVHGRGFRFVAPMPETPKTAAVVEAAPFLPDLDGRPSIAILPFENLSGNQADQFFADGLTEETVANLARFRYLFVFSRSTSAKLAEDGADIGRIRSELNADYAVEGSVRKTETQVRARARLIDAATGGHIFSEQFDRPCTPAGVFEIQDQIAELVAARIANRHGPIGRHHARTTARGLSSSWETYDWITRYYEYYRTYDQDLHAALRDGLPRALESDPGSSDGWSALSAVLLDEYRHHINERPGVSVLDLALEHAHKGVDCDPQNAFSLVTLALAHFHRHEHEAFRAVADRAIASNPGHADVLAEIGHCHAFLGEWDRAVPLVKRAMELSPVHPGWYHHTTSWYAYFGGDVAGALADISSVPMPGFFWYHAHRAWFSAELGDLGTAAAEARIMLEIYPQFAEYVRHEAHIWCIDEDLLEIAIAGWEKAGIRFG